MSSHDLDQRAWSSQLARDGVLRLSNRVLVDVDLFVRLQQRGATGALDPGHNGLDDWMTALRLVRGAPLAEIVSPWPDLPGEVPIRRGWGWVVDEPFYYLSGTAVEGMVWRLVNALTTEGHLTLAREVVEIARNALPGHRIVTACQDLIDRGSSADDEV